MKKSLASYIQQREKNRLEHSVHGVPVVVKDVPSVGDWNVHEFVDEFKDIMPPQLLRDVEIIYIGEFPELKDKNAVYADGAIFITNQEPTVYDMLENVVHEVAHSLEMRYNIVIYDESLESEFMVKRKLLKQLLDRAGYEFPEKYYLMSEYTREFDEFLSGTVGYPALLSLTMGLYLSPYGATSLQEYFANGFEKYYLEDPSFVAKISPELYKSIERVHYESETE